MMKEATENGIPVDSIDSQQVIEKHSTALSQDQVIHITLSDKNRTHKRKEDHSKLLDVSIAVDEEETLLKGHSTPKIKPSMGLSVVTSKLRQITNNPIMQKVISLLGTLLFLVMVKKLMKPSLLRAFFIWMEEHPMKGLAAYMIIYPLHMVLMLPSTPLCMGAGFVFKLRYGWVLGVTICSLVSLFGSLIGSVACFLMGRYCFRSSVRRWSKKYPLFEPIDQAVAEKGFRVMVLIYLTPAVPLGPMSYMMGTTSMALLDFAKAKIAHLPTTALYIYLGAATGTLMTQDDIRNDTNENNTSAQKGTIHKANFEEMSLSPKVIAAGILLSIGIIAFISVKMKQELQQVRDGFWVTPCCHNIHYFMNSRYLLHFYSMLLCCSCFPKILDKQKKKTKDAKDNGIELKSKVSSPISNGTRQRHHIEDSDLRPRNINKGTEVV